MKSDRRVVHPILGFKVTRSFPASRPPDPCHRRGAAPIPFFPDGKWPGRSAKPAGADLILPELLVSETEPPAQDRPLEEPHLKLRPRDDDLLGFTVLVDDDFLLDGKSWRVTVSPKPDAATEFWNRLLSLDQSVNARVSRRAFAYADPRRRRVAEQTPISARPKSAAVGSGTELTT